MRKTITLFTTALLATTSMASAGGLSDQIVEAPVEQEPMVADAAPSINPTIVVIGVLGALLLAAALDDDDDDDDGGVEPIGETDGGGSAGDEE